MIGYIPLIDKKLLFTLLGLVLLSFSGYAQLCTGSLGDPVVKIDFGAGIPTHGAALTGTTSYTYSSADFPTDGTYTIERTTAGAGNVWWSTTDHTGDSGGYMMVVNASVSKTDYFYKSTVSGLCPGTTYEFAAWVVNLLRASDISPPNITFTILNASTGAVIGTPYNTGTIPLTPSGPTWKQYGMYFTTPAGVSDIIIQMTNNSNGGAPANDLALDDITFRPCGPTMQSSFSTISTETTKSSCSGVSQTYTLTSDVSTGYNNPVYQWQVNNGSGWVVITGATTKTYSLASPTVAGTYQYRLVSSESSNAGTLSCQIASNILTLTVTGAATAAYTYTGSACLGDATLFKDASVSSLTITKWAWDFGDGQTSALQNPTHTYTASGNYPVTLTVTNSGGCTTTSVVQTVHISAKPIAAFTYATPSCAEQPVTLTDQSTTADGTIAQWIWNYGDNSAVETRTVKTPFTHTYATAGTYAVTLQVVSASGCTSLVKRTNMVVNAVPVVDFVLPDVCLADASALFTNSTTIADGTASGLTYSWNFGDSQATTANSNTSTLKNPTHKYSKAAVYTVTLTVTSQNGCVAAIKSKSFTVNGSTPKAAFTAKNTTGGTGLCSGDDVLFDASNSTVDFGSITKIVFYYDYNNQPTVTATYIKSQGQIPADNIFRHNYGLFNTPAGKNYLVRMIAYSGESCSNTYDQTITIKANPTVTLSTIGAICQESGPVQIAENKNGYSGTGVFSGTGISASGLFNPLVSGPGTFTINYVFTSTNGCTYTSTQDVKVNATPTVSAGTDLHMLEGGQITIDATASGDGPLTYKWTLANGSKATNLDHDDVLHPIATPTDDVSYLLTVKSANGCTASATVNIAVLKTPVVPNTFTPNSDGVNDSWEIKYLDSYPNCTVDIFNRLGTKIYGSFGYPAPWDGTYKGSPLPAGVYYYLINPKNGRKAMSGSLTIIR